MAARAPPPPSVLGLYRSFLRRARGVFDPVARVYVETEVRRRFRRYQSATTTAAAARARLGEGQKLYRQLGRAIYGDRKAATKLVDLAYGRRGHRRHAMLREFERAHPHDADRLLREFVPQDLVKRNRARVFPPAPPALQAQAEAILCVQRACPGSGSGGGHGGGVCTLTCGTPSQAAWVRTPVAAAVRRAAGSDARASTRRRRPPDRVQAHPRHATPHPPQRPRGSRARASDRPTAPRRPLRPRPCAYV
jgi:hypothetical protein